MCVWVGSELPCYRIVAAGQWMFNGVALVDVASALQSSEPLG